MVKYTTKLAKTFGLHIDSCNSDDANPIEDHDVVSPLSLVGQPDFAIHKLHYNSVEFLLHNISPVAALSIYLQIFKNIMRQICIFIYHVYNINF